MTWKGQNKYRTLSLEGNWGVLLPSHLISARQNPVKELPIPASFPLKRLSSVNGSVPHTWWDTTEWRARTWFLLCFMKLQIITNLSSSKLVLLFFWPEVGAAIMLQTFKQQSPLTHCMGGMRPNMQPRPTEWSAGPTASNLFCFPVFRTVFFLRLKWSVSPWSLFFPLTQINFLTTRSVTASFIPVLQTWGTTNAITKKRTKQCKYENTTNVAIVSNRNQFVPDTAQKVNITPSQAEYNKSVHTWNGFFLLLFPLLAVFGIIFFFLLLCKHSTAVLFILRRSPPSSSPGKVFWI